MDPAGSLMIFPSRWYNGARADPERTEEMQPDLTTEVLRMAQTIDDNMKQTARLIDIVSKMAATIDVLQKSNESLHKSVQSQQEVIDRLVHARLAQGKQVAVRPAPQPVQSGASLACELAAKEYLWRNNPVLAWLLGPK